MSRGFYSLFVLQSYSLANIIFFFFLNAAQHDMCSQ